MHSHQTVTADFNQRLLRFFVWALLMLGAFFVTVQFSLAKTILVPMVFLPLMVPIVFLPMRKTENPDSQTRFWRFALWASLMFVACLVTMQFDQRRTIFVPIVFLPLMVPMVLMPLKRLNKTSTQV